MKSLTLSLVAVLDCVWLGGMLSQTCAEEPKAVFQIKLAGTVASSNSEEPLRGRLVVLLISDRSRALGGRHPIDGPFWDDPQPLFGCNAELRAGHAAIIGDDSDCFPIPPSQLPPGHYRAQARLDLHRNNSDWRREADNLWSNEVNFEVKANEKPPTVELELSNRVEPVPARKTDGIEWFEIKSELLSKFRGTDVYLKAGIVLPKEQRPGVKYPALYEVPGFGGNHTEAWAASQRPARSDQSKRLGQSVFRIFLDPEGPNGHSLFVDSANNGPCGEALTRELIPALERQFPLIAHANARMLRGHSSGGWSVLWLAMNYPDCFGAAWSSAPDPVDFRRFQKVDIYHQPNFYLDANGHELPSFRSHDQVKMTIRQETRGEDVLGPDNTSAQQWDSWFAAFGPKNEHGNPAALFDPKSGLIDPQVAETYRRFDLCELVKGDPAKYMPIFRRNVRLICGTEDSFYLNEAVALLNQELIRLGSQAYDVGYVKLIPGDHGTILSSDSAKSIPAEMLEHLRVSGFSIVTD